MDLRTWNTNIYEKKFVQFSAEQIASICKIYFDWQTLTSTAHSATYERPELYRSVGIEEIRENNFSLVPRRYIEFVDRDKDIDYGKVMSESAVRVADILARQQANHAALEKAFAALTDREAAAEETARLTVERREGPGADALQRYLPQNQEQ